MALDCCRVSSDGPTFPLAKVPRANRGATPTNSVPQHQSLNAAGSLAAEQSVGVLPLGQLHNRGAQATSYQLRLHLRIQVFHGGLPCAVAIASNQKVLHALAVLSIPVGMEDKLLRSGAASAAHKREGQGGGQQGRGALDGVGEHRPWTRTPRPFWISPRNLKAIPVLQAPVLAGGFRDHSAARSPERARALA